jgi:hypothetical protein
MKLVRSLLLIAILAAGVFAAVQYFKGRDSGGESRADAAGNKKKEPPPRVEEKYGFTSEGLAP